MGFESFLLFFYLSTLSVLGLVGVPLPFSVPPLPEEPALLRIAPRDSLACFAWSGAATPDAKSANHTERLCAEPELRALVEALLRATRQAIGDELGGAAGLAQSTLHFACTALQRPGCVFVRSIARAPKPTLEAGIAFKLDGELAAGRALFGAYSMAMRAMAHGEMHEDVEVDGVRFRALPTDVEHAFVGIAEVDGWMLVAVGRDVPALMLAGLRDTSKGLLDNAGWRALAPGCQVARPATRTFVDCERLQRVLPELVGNAAVGFTEVLGVQRATAAVAVTGFDGDGFCSKSRVAVPEREGLLGAFAGPPVTQDSVLAVPVDADVALLMRVEPEKVEQALLTMFKVVGGDRVAGDYDEFQREFAQHLGLDWRRDLLTQLDGQVAAWNSASQGGFGITAATGVLGVRDVATFKKSMAQLLDAMGKRMKTKDAARAGGVRLGRRDGYLETFAHQDHTVHWIDSYERDVPFAPSWCVTPTALAISLWPQSLRATLDALDAPNPDRSLARLPAVSKRGNATLLVHLDVASLLQRGYPWLWLLLQQGAYEWQREGFDLDAADLPRLEALRHVGRELSRLEPDATGFTFTRTGTLPLLDPLTIAAIAAFGSSLAHL
jgi:hypothetical protein